jgi:adenylate kinase family enzyme
MRRVVVAGSQGSGKTRLSLALGAKLGLPAIHLDTLYWRPGWKPSQRDDFRQRVAQAIAADSWIIDGSYSGLCLDLTIARADCMVILDRPRWLCVWRVLKRSALQRKGERTDLPEGCPEQFDWDLVGEAWRWPVERRPQIEAERRKYGASVPVVCLSTDREVAAFVESTTPAT